MPNSQELHWRKIGEAPKSSQTSLTKDGDVFFWQQIDWRTVQISFLDGTFFTGEKPEGEAWMLPGSFLLVGEYECDDADEIYKIIVSKSERSVQFKLVRRLEEDEVLNKCTGVIKRIWNGRWQFSRIDDVASIEPDVDTYINVNGVAGLHRGKLICFHVTIKTTTPVIRRNTDNSLVIESNSKVVSFYSVDERPFLYGLDYCGHLIIANVETMECIKLKKVGSFEYGRTNLVTHNGEIICCLNSHFDIDNVLSATLPQNWGGSSADSSTLADNERLRKEVEMIKALVESEKTGRLKMEHENAIAKGRILELEQQIDLQCKQDLVVKNEMMQNEISDLKRRFSRINSRILENGKLKFFDSEVLSEILICFQLRNGSVCFFKNFKTRELYTVQSSEKINADLSSCDKISYFEFIGVIENSGYFYATVGKMVQFYRATFENNQFHFSLVNEFRKNDITSLNTTQPYYVIEKGRKWIIYGVNESIDSTDKTVVDISDCDFFSKYRKIFHRGNLYLFLDNSTESVITVNEKLIKIEHPSLDEVNIYAVDDSDFIYILNWEFCTLLIFDTTNLKISSFEYNPFPDFESHSIVGVHEGIITLKCEGSFGRNLVRAELPLM